MVEHAYDFESWIVAMRADGYAAATVRARHRAVLQVGRQTGVDPHHLTREDIGLWLGSRDLAPASRRAYLHHLKAWSAFADLPGLTQGFRLPPVPPMQPDPLPEGDLRRLQHWTARDDRETAWVALGAYAGFRAHETARYHPRDLRGDTLRVLGKGGRVDFLPVAPVLAAALAPFSDLDGQPWSVRPERISHIISQRAREIDVQMRYHQLRHRFGTAIYRATRDLLLTMRLMRHARATITAGYAALGDDDGRQAVLKLPGSEPGPHPEE